MPNTDIKLSAEYQNDYRKKQKRNGMTRYEIQIPETLKNQIEQIAHESAQEMVVPRSYKQRMAKARIQVLKESTQGVRHEFFELKDRIKALQQQITALSPSFFESEVDDKAPLPDAINALPDESLKLKQIIASIYKVSQVAKTQAIESERQAKQYQKLYNMADAENDRLKGIIEAEGLMD